jgi:hypothetical protein
MKKIFFILCVTMCPQLVHGQQQEEKRVSEEKQQITLPQEQSPTSNRPRVEPPRPPVVIDRPTPRPPIIVDSWANRNYPNPWVQLQMEYMRQRRLEEQVRPVNREFRRDEVPPRRRLTDKQRQQLLAARIEYLKKVEYILRNR